METKYCPVCNKDLPETDFALDGKKLNKEGKPYRRRICNSCRTELRKEKKREKQFNKSISKKQTKEKSSTKVCIVCGKEKPVHKFAKDGHVNKDGTVARRKYCNPCRSKIRKGEISQESINILKQQQKLQKDIEKKQMDLEKTIEKEQEESQTKKDMEKSKLVAALVELARSDIQRLDDISEKEFISKTNSEYVFKEEGYDFEELKDEAMSVVLDMGFHRSAGDEFGKGRYLIVGDSHGKHTKRKMFKLLKNLNENIGFDHIIHVGHILDDDNVISYCWKDFDNLIVVSKLEEAHHIEKHTESGYDFNVIRDFLYLGKLKVMNQDLIQDYVKTSVSRIDQKIYQESLVVNLHRHEMDTRCTYKDNLVISSPGCLCEKHIVKTIKQIDFTSGYQVRQAKAESFIKYRRMKHMCEFWEQGMLIVEVDENGDFSIVPCRIKNLEDEYVTSYFDKIYIGDEVVEPHNKVFMNTDMHCDKHDVKVLDIQDQVVKDYKPDIYVNIGDMQNNKSLNHHDMEKGIPVFRSLLDENAVMAHVLNKMSKWSDDNYFLYGNHERFMMDFYKKYPQLQELLEKMLHSPLKDSGYQLIGYKGVLEIDNLKFLHGDMRMYGQSGKALEKISRTFGVDSVIGHLHFNSIRFGCYIIGMSGEFDQEYNEVNASKWIHGFGICNQYCGLNFISCIGIKNYKTILNDKTYVSDNDEFWKMPNYNVEVNYKFEEDDE